MLFWVAATGGVLAALLGDAQAQQPAKDDLRQAVHDRIDRFHREARMEAACSLLASYANCLTGLDKLVALARDRSLRGRGFERIRISDFFRDTDHNRVVVIDFRATPGEIRAHLLKQRPTREGTSDPADSE